MAKMTEAEAKRRLKACGWRLDWCQRVWGRPGWWKAAAHLLDQGASLYVKGKGQKGDVLEDLVTRIEAMEADRG